MEAKCQNACGPETENGKKKGKTTASWAALVASVSLNALLIMFFSLSKFSSAPDAMDAVKRVDLMGKVTEEKPAKSIKEHEPLLSTYGGHRDWVGSGGGGVRGQPFATLPTSIAAARSATDSPVVFQFLVGLEGTGHHLHQKLYRGSPAHKRLASYGLLDDVKNLLKSLWNRDEPSQGLWSATCAMADEESEWWKQENESTDGDKLFNSLVEHLKSLDLQTRANIEADATMQEGDDLVIAVNSGIGAKKSAAFLSYPLQKGPCRFLQYPILDIFYEACNVAGVRCQHSVSFRDPYRVLKSTSMTRKFASRHVQLQTLHSMAAVIQGQMLSHKDRLVACWESDRGADWGARDLGDLFGWKSRGQFDEFYGKLFLEPSPVSEKDKNEITKDKKLQVYMNSMIKDMHSLRSACLSQLEQTRT